ncbi:MAG TPA: MarR family winged helix-turn-helix transcriptional regulator [Vicinamibacterales bacterium]|jgi:DNA-binding MarR family transcriptional regulator|nr:MarR family winged helix-turn-helix transcriptional regulator [Vicinamibacterales bacterium]
MGSHIIAREGAAPADIQAILDGIRFLVHRLRESSRHAEVHLGLSSAQMFVLQHLSAARELSINDLATRTYTHQSSVSVVVSRLVRKGLVTRGRAADDARRSALSLSPKGRRLLEAAPEAPQAALVRTLLGLPTRRRREMAAAMRQVASAMGAPRTQSMFFEALSKTR